MESTGRPEVAYCNWWKPRVAQLRHEIWLTDFLLCYPEAAILRGFRVDQRIRADAEMTYRGQKFYVELDSGEQSHRQVRERQLAYARVRDFMLYVTLSERRLAGLIKHADLVKHIALFTTLERVMADTHGAVWIDWQGRTVAI